MLRLDFRVQSVFSGSLGSHVPDASHGNSFEDRTQVLRVKELGQISDGRGTGERNAVRASGKHCRNSAAVQMIRNYGAIRRDDINAGSRLFQSFRQKVPRYCGPRNQEIQAAERFRVRQRIG